MNLSVGRKSNMQKYDNSAAESAAIIIQNYYRRYKQYLFYRNHNNQFSYLSSSTTTAPRTTKNKDKSSLQNESMEDNHSFVPKRFKKSTYDDSILINDDYEVDEGLYSSNNSETTSANVSMANSTSHSDVEYDEVNGHDYHPSVDILDDDNVNDDDDDEGVPCDEAEENFMIDLSLQSTNYHLYKINHHNKRCLHLRVPSSSDFSSTLQKIHQTNPTQKMNPT